MTDIMQDIADYIEFLRKCGYSVTISTFDTKIRHMLHPLFEYEIHLPVVCSYLKSNKGTCGRCLKNKHQLISNKASEPYYACCYAGIEEFVIPIVCDNITVMCVNVSGYRGKLQRSQFLKNRISKRCDNRFDNLYSELSENVPSMEEIVKITKPLVYMVSELYRHCINGMVCETHQDRLYSAALEYIYNNFMNPITCETVAKSVNYSLSYLRHVFREKCGISVGEFINNVRMNKAAELLKSTGRNITEIAAAVGFDNPNYFSVAFKTKFGVSPVKNKRSCSKMHRTHKA